MTASSLYINDEFFEKPREENSYLKVGTPKLSIVYEDENILLADKKPGVLCHSAGVWDYNTLIANIQAYMAQKGEWRPREENAFAPGGIQKPACRSTAPAPSRRSRG